MSEFPPLPGGQGADRGSRLFRLWMSIADWLGGCKPLELILGAVLAITAIAWLVRLA